MKSLIPDYVFDSIYDISPSWLYQKGIRGVLIDLDGTLASRKAPLPPDTVNRFLEAMRQAGILVLVFSNNFESRVRTFCYALGVPYISRARKPFRKGFQRAAKRLGLLPSQIAVIGDQIFTDVFGGNRAGALTCYVETLDRRYFWIRARYRMERSFIRHGQKQERTDPNEPGRPTDS